MEYLPQLPKLQVFPGPNDITLISLCSAPLLFTTPTVQLSLPVHLEQDEQITRKQGKKTSI